MYWVENKIYSLLVALKQADIFVFVFNCYRFIVILYMRLVINLKLLENDSKNYSNVMNYVSYLEKRKESY